MTNMAYEEMRVPRDLAIDEIPQPALGQHGLLNLFPCLLHRSLILVYSHKPHTSMIDSLRIPTVPSPHPYHIVNRHAIVSPSQWKRT
jgi:hypothetical protein